MTALAKARSSTRGGKKALKAPTLPKAPKAPTLPKALKAPTTPKALKTPSARKPPAPSPARVLPPKRDKRALPLVTTSAAPRKEVSCTVCALCCTYVAIEINPPNSLPRATELLWYLYHEGVSLYENDGDWMVQFETRCMNLLEDNRCGVYETRPHICREYSEKECEVNTVDDGQTFYEPAAFMEHLARRRPRLHAKLAAGFAPPPAPVGRPARNPLAFRRRLARVKALGA